MTTLGGDARPVLLGLLSGEIELTDAERLVGGMSWDPLGEPLPVPDSALVDLLRRYVDGSLEASFLCRWAELFECREDVLLGSRAADVVFELANPYQYGDLTVSRAQVLADGLASRDLTGPSDR